MENGYVVIKNAFSKEKAEEWMKDLWVRLGMDPNDKSTWEHEGGKINMPMHKRESVPSFSPKVSAILQFSSDYFKKVNHLIDFVGVGCDERFARRGGTH